MLQEAPITFKSGPLTLEGLLAQPEKRPASAAVVCHPHPQYGGSMYNNVVEAMLAALHQIGYATLRFNFRGVGASEGEYDEGRGEADDAKAAMKFLTATDGVEVSNALMAGYSFGAMVAMAAGGAMAGVAAIVAVAPPIGMMKLDRAAKFSGKRVILLAGSRDPYCPAAQLKELAKSLDNARLAIIDGADHFFGGFESPLSQELIGALRAG